MVKMAARVLKIGMHLRFDPKFTVEFEHFDQKYFRQAYYRQFPKSHYLQIVDSYHVDKFQ